MTKTLEEIAEAMRDIDFTMLSTKTDGGAISARPMSNNRDVDYDGDSWFFSCDTARTIPDIERDPQVGMTLQAKGGLLGKPGMFIGIEGRAELIRNKAAFEEHWNPDLERWFKQGVDTPGLVLIRVRAERLHYWDGEDQGEVALTGARADT